MRLFLLFVPLVAASALTACDELVEYSRRPPQQSTVAATTVSVLTPVYVADRITAEEIASRLEAEVPSDFGALKTDVKRALCKPKQDKNGKSLAPVCESMRVTGSLTRKGPVEIGGVGNTLVLQLHVAYDLTAAGLGKSKIETEDLTGEAVISVNYPLSLDGQWHLVAGAGPTIDWRTNAEIPVRAGTLSMAAAASPLLAKQLAGLKPKIAAAFPTERLRSLTELAWKQLYSPIELSTVRHNFIRGEPSTVTFAGIAFVNGGAELRTAILTELATYEGDRPLPLIPQPMPDLSPADGDTSKPAIAVAIDIKYADLADSLMARLPAGGEIEGASDGVSSVAIRGLQIFPSATHLAIGADIEAKLPEKWQTLRGRAFLLGLPEVGADEASLKLGKLATTETTLSPKVLSGKRLVVEPKPLERAFAGLPLIDLKALIDNAKKGYSSAIEQRIGTSGLRLRRNLAEAHVGKIELLEQALRVTLLLSGDLTIAAGAPTVAIDGQNNPTSFAGVPKLK